MTDATIAQTTAADSRDAGRDIGRQIANAFADVTPDVVILFASPTYDFQSLLHAVHEECRPERLVGCSSAGEFTSRGLTNGSACAVALRAPEMQFAATLARGIRQGPASAAAALAAGLNGAESRRYRYRTALVLADVLGGYTDELVGRLVQLTGGAYQLFGGGAGDDARFEQTFVFCDREAVSDAAVALEILSDKPIGIGVRHGWQPATPPMRVTESHDTCLVSLNATPAVEVLEEHAEATGQQLDEAQPLPFFLHNVLGIAEPDGYKLRVPLAIQPGGSLALASDIPAGATAHIMQTEPRSAVFAAATATRAAVEQLDSRKPEVAIFFDCVATRLRIGQEFGFELDAVQQALGDTPFAGCNTYGQIARADGQFSGFHNCTAVVCVIPE